MTPRRFAIRVSMCFVIIASAASATGGSIGGVPDPVSATASRVEVPQVALVIGDSAIASLRWVRGADGALVGFEHVLDLESCRRLLAPSCRGREGRVPPTVDEALRAYGPGFARVLVVATGYNDGTSGFATAFRTVVATARRLGYEQIVWWSLRSDVDYVAPGSIGNHEAFAINNRTLDALLATGGYPDVVLADWGGYSAGRVSWFATDGVHHRTVGAWAAADYLSRKMAFLDGRRCPFPTTPTGIPDDPCPDPDVTGPVADIVALYPIGTDGVLCYEVGVERRIECRHDSVVLQLTREMQIGDRGRDVEALQSRLARLGAPLPVTGLFGDLTEVAVRNAQVREGLSPTGRADRATLTALGFDVSAVVAS
ncbi:MAG: peptidoglycan-binding protein [Ilumatobacteraceae bacterium]